jgi:hypothetical protein
MFLMSLVASLHPAGELRQTGCEQLVERSLDPLRFAQDFGWPLRRSQIASSSACKLRSDPVVLCKPSSNILVKRIAAEKNAPAEAGACCIRFVLGLELNLHRELQLARRAGVAGWEACAADSGKGCELVARVVGCRIRRYRNEWLQRCGQKTSGSSGLAVVRVVEHIERISTHLEIQVLGDLGVLNQGQVHIRESGSVYAIATHISKRQSAGNTGWCCCRARRSQRTRNR